VDSSSAWFAFGAGFVLAGGLLWLVVWLLRRRSDTGAEDSRRLDLLLTEAAAARQASEAVDRRFEEMRRAVEDRVTGVEQRLAEGQRSVADQLVSSGRILSEVGEKIGRVVESSQRIERLATDMGRLEDLLKPPKVRGLLGETFLEQALRQALPSRCWTLQHRFPDGVVVDAAIHVGDRLVAIDSKFPLENFRRSRELEDEGEKRRARRAFAADVRRHMEAIAEKYIRPAYGTFDFALMYVPAEAVYAEIVEEGEDAILTAALLERRVVPVSPRLLYAYLATVALGLRGLEVQENARQIHGELHELQRHWEQVEAPFGRLGTHLSNTQKQYEEATRALVRFSTRLSGVTDRAEEVEAGSAPIEQPSLLPPS
jgi:DNA recombination protein RmuC